MIFFIKINRIKYSEIEKIMEIRKYFTNEKHYIYMLIAYYIILYLFIRKKYEKIITISF